MRWGVVPSPALSLTRRHSVGCFFRQPQQHRIVFPCGGSLGTRRNRLTGADWLWWWAGVPGEWFGCLVQAKRLVPGRTGPTFGFDYRPRPSTADPAPPAQVQRLLDAADLLGVPAAYVLYRSPVLGLPGAWRCASIEPDWHTGAATFVAAPIVYEWFQYGWEADLGLTRPIECLTCLTGCGPDQSILAWYAARLADPEVRRILRAPPSTAARRAFRSLFTDSVALRSAQFRGRTADEVDRMHSGFPLGEHFIRGVREPPEYVLAVLEGQVVDDVPEIVAGIVVVSDE